MASSFNEENDASMGPISSINVTPFVDVVLVLLVIFMVTAPLIMKETLGIRLPKAQSSEGKAVSSMGIVITRQGQILFGGESVTEEKLKEKVTEALKVNPDAQAIVSADEEARHGDVIHAIDLIKTAGMNRFAIEIRRP